MIRRLLLIDDSESFRAAASALMRADGFDVSVAVDGRSGLALAARLAPEVVVVDIGLPDCSGFDVAAALSRRDAEAQTVLVSSRDWIDLGPRVAACGARGFLTKESFDSGALTALLAARRPASDGAGLDRRGPQDNPEPPR